MNTEEKDEHSAGESKTRQGSRWCTEENQLKTGDLLTPQEF